ncbi:MAG: hypothetical protein WKG07_27920 [Hymenobacter sp.]
MNTATAISDANEYLPYPLPEGEDYETVGGLLNVHLRQHSGGGRRGRAGALRVSGAAAARRRVVELVRVCG